jgi:hypothetical protein
MLQLLLRAAAGNLLDTTAIAIAMAIIMLSRTRNLSHQRKIKMLRR